MGAQPTSSVRAATGVVLAATRAGTNIAPDWTIGVVAGAGALIDGYLGALLEPLLPERALRATLGPRHRHRGRLHHPGIKLISDDPRPPKWRTEFRSKLGPPHSGGQHILTLPARPGSDSAKMPHALTTRVGRR
jgi:hypothetical protein